MVFKLVFLSGILMVVVVGQRYQATPVPILKQINKHNEDGSYSYGYEGADGSFKIETKHPTGEVYGKYGYIDDTGKLREVEYGASRRGFEPAGTDIQVAPPTLHSNGYNQVDDKYDDGQYREDPSVYYKSSSSSSFSNRPSYSGRPSNFGSFSQNYQPPQQYHNPAPSRAPAPSYNYNPAPAPSYNHNPVQHTPRYLQHDPRQFAGHPATNFDINTGSYSVNYSGK